VASSGDARQSRQLVADAASVRTAGPARPETVDELRRRGAAVPPSRRRRDAPSATSFARRRVAAPQAQQLAAAAAIAATAATPAIATPGDAGLPGHTSRSSSSTRSTPATPGTFRRSSPPPGRARRRDLEALARRLGRDQAATRRSTAAELAERDVLRTPHAAAPQAQQLAATAATLAIATPATLAIATPATLASRGRGRGISRGYPTPSAGRSALRGLTDSLAVRPATVWWTPAARRGAQSTTTLRCLSSRVAAIASHHVRRLPVYGLRTRLSKGRRNLGPMLAAFA
jgi:hypothetical protein